MDKPVEAHLLEQLRKLKEKYAAMGQDISSYLDGLLYSDYLTYWDYIHLDTLLSLQTPITHFPDERIFIVYHQISELYFNLVLWEIEQIHSQTNPSPETFSTRVERLIRYFRQLESSFEIMIEGMEREQFLRFRMSLLPASGFQSAQYRLIEIASTDLTNLVHRNNGIDPGDHDALLERLYWREGATELASGEKTLTLKQFENKYMDLFRKKAMEARDTNLRAVYKKHFAGNKEIETRLRTYDAFVNVRWPLAHLRSVGRYLQGDEETIKATGGTNWQRFLPPRFQHIMFFPELWSDEEKEGWGRGPSVRDRSDEKGYLY